MKISSLINMLKTCDPDVEISLVIGNVRFDDFDLNTNDDVAFVPLDVRQWSLKPIGKGQEINPFDGEN